MYKKILVTGGNGLVGAALQFLAAELPEQEFIFSSSKDCDLTKYDEVIKYFQRHKPDAVIHLAAKAGGIGLSMKYPATLLRDNVWMDFNVLEAARLNGVQKNIMTLSTGMYPADVKIPIKEEYIHDGYPHPSNYSYSFAKRLIEPSIKAYKTEYDMNVIGLIPNGIFGENMNYNYDDSTMFAALIRRFYENKDKDNDIVIWGDGSPLREYTYAKDIARIYLWCLERYNDEQVLHIGTTQEQSVKDVAFMIAEIMKVHKKRITFDTSKPKGQYRKGTDNSKFMNISKFSYTPFRIGLENTINYFIENYPQNLRL